MSAARDLLDGLVLEDGRRWGSAAADFQRRDAEAMLAVDGSRYAWLSRPRGASKTSDIAGVCLVSMLAVLPPGARLFAAAADRDQARLLADAAAGFVRRTPELRTAFRTDAYKITAARSGSVLEVLASDGASSWGLLGDLFVLDELCQWHSTSGPRQFFEAVSSASAKRESAKLVIATTSGSPSHWSRKVYDHAVASDLWLVSDTPGPCPWISPEKLEDERQRLPDASFRRLHLNEWAAGDEQLVNADDLEACVRLEGEVAPEPGTRYVLGLDVGLRRDRTAIAVCHGERLLDEGGHVRGTRVVLDRLRTWTGRGKADEVQLDEVGEFVAWASEAYGHAEVVFDPSQAILLAQLLRKRGVRMQEFTFSAASNSRLALTLHHLIRSRCLWLPDDRELLDELANVRLKETSPGVFRIDHDADKHDDRAIALALAAHRLIEKPPGSSAAWTNDEDEFAESPWVALREGSPAGLIRPGFKF